MFESWDSQSEPLPGFSEIIGSVPSPTLSDIIRWDIPETYQEGSVTYNFQSFQRPWIKICGPNQLIAEINYTSSRNYFTLEAIYNLITGKTKTRISQPSPSIGGVADPKPFRSYTFILNNIGQIDKVFPKEKYAVI